MAKVKTVYECQSCGYESPKWMGICTRCGSAEGFQEVRHLPEVEHKSKLPGGVTAAAPILLSSVGSTHEDRTPSGIVELDRVLGGGFMKGSFVLLGGDPGIGKSTLTLQIGRANPSMKMLYVSGEESPAQIRQRASRLGMDHNELYLYAETDVMKVLDQARTMRPDLLIIDSIQTLYRAEQSGMPGNLSQIRECALLLMQFAKQENITTLIIGHMTKDGDLAGPKVLEHMVDTVLQFEGDNNYAYRLLRSIKNRFGAANEIGVFEMTDQGLIDVVNPSQLFISGFDHSISGNAVVCTMEGSRPLLTEVQALVSSTSYGMPQRTASGFDQRRLALLLAVLEKRAGYRFADQDVFVNVAGGMKLIEPATDLGIACAMVSALSNRPVGKNTVFIGEIGLGGEIRGVHRIAQRVNEAKKMGFETAVVPESNLASLKIPEIQLIGARHIEKVLGLLF
jgi:DNA repair protein RadA/Sms